MWGPPTPQQKASVNVWAIVSVASGAVGLLVLAILLGPLALITGLVGEYLSRKRGLGGQKLAILGILLGAVNTLLAAQAFGGLN